jgi:hypothetical protein
MDGMTIGEVAELTAPNFLDLSGTYRTEGEG